MNTVTKGDPEPPYPSVSLDMSAHPDVTNIKNYYDEAFICIQQALTYDEKGNRKNSLLLYKNALKSIKWALAIPTEGADKEGDHWVRARGWKNKLLRTQIQIQERVEKLSAILEARSDSSASSSVRDLEDEALGDSIMQNLGAENGSEFTRDEIPNAIEIFLIPDGVQIYFISSDGFVSAPSCPSSLGIYRLCVDKSPLRNQSGARLPSAFLSIGNWTYPLLPGKSPALHSDTRTYIFPDLNSPDKGASVGVTLPEKLPSGERRRLQGLLKYLTDMREAPTAPTEEAHPQLEPPRPVGKKGEPRGSVDSTRASTQLSKGIVTAADWISWGLGKGAEKTSALLKHGSTKLREKITPNPEPRSVNAHTQKGIDFAKNATNTTVNVSVFIVDCLTRGTLALGGMLAPTARQQSEKYLPKSMTDSSKGPSKLDQMAEVATSGLQGFGTVWLGLEAAGKVLGKSVIDETVAVVQHKYGLETASATESAMHAVKNVAITGYTANNLGIKAIAKRTARNAGVAVLRDYVSTSSARDEKFAQSELSVYGSDVSECSSRCPSNTQPGLEPQKSDAPLPRLPAHGPNAPLPPLPPH